jgi:hypothetical protein
MTRFEDCQSTEASAGLHIFTISVKMPVESSRRLKGRSQKEMGKSIFYQLTQLETRYRAVISQFYAILIDIDIAISFLYRAIQYLAVLEESKS